jgi:hypothetical protein
VAKISVHASGKIHYRLAPKLKQDLAPLMQLGLGPWFHAFEIRFLLSESANRPLGESKSLKNKKAFVIPVPKGSSLLGNLIIGAAGTALNCPLPAEFGGGQVLWRTRLRDGRPAILLGRILELDNQNRDHIKYLRETLKLTAMVSGTPGEAYVELHHLHWSPEGGNVVQVVPMGDEAVRSEQDLKPSLEIRKFRYQSPRATTDVIAPDGQRVAVLDLDDVDKEIELSRIGRVRTQLEHSRCDLNLVI